MKLTIEIPEVIDIDHLQYAVFDALAPYDKVTDAEFYFVSSFINALKCGEDSVVVFTHNCFDVK